MEMYPGKFVSANCIGSKIPEAEMQYERRNLGEKIEPVMRQSPKGNGHWHELKSGQTFSFPNGATTQDGATTRYAA